MRRFLAGLICAILLPTLAHAQLRVPREWTPVDQNQVAHKATGHACPKSIGQFELYGLHNQAGQALCLYKTPCSKCDATSLKASFGLLPKWAKPPLEEFLQLTAAGATRMADPPLLGASEAARISVTERGQTVEATLWIMPMPNGIRVVSVMGAPAARDDGMAFAKAALEASMQPPAP